MAADPPASFPPLPSALSESPVNVTAKFGPSPRRQAELAGCAAQVADQYCPEGRIEPEAIANAEGIAFHYASFLEEFDGTLIPTEGRFCIVLNTRRAGRGSARSRFAFAHELAHYFLPEHRAAILRGTLAPHLSDGETAGGSAIEREANRFASHLLLPTRRVNAAAQGLAWGTTQVLAVAERFGTSLTATAFRLLALDLWPAPAAVFHWDPLGNLAARRRSPETVGRSPDCDEVVAVIPEGTATAHAVRNLRVGIESRQGEARTWFPELESDHPENIRVREEVMSIGHYGWLTLIYAHPGSRESVAAS